MLDAVIIGGGQQGLALGKKLKDKGKTFVILEADNAIGARWRRHYDSLELFTPRAYSALPGMKLTGDPEGYATKDEFADYLETYTTRFSLPVMTGARVPRLYKEEDVFVAETERQAYRAQCAVIATGYGKPFIPKTDHLGFNIHSSAYKNPAQVPGKKALVVGSGNSAAQIAVELARTRETHIAMREMPRIVLESYVWGR